MNSVPLAHVEYGDKNHYIICLNPFTSAGTRKHSYRHKPRHQDTQLQTHKHGNMAHTGTQADTEENTTGNASNFKKNTHIHTQTRQFRSHLSLHFPQPTCCCCWGLACVTTTLWWQMMMGYCGSVHMNVWVCVCERECACMCLHCLFHGFKSFGLLAVTLSAALQ